MFPSIRRVSLGHYAHGDLDLSINIYLRSNNNVTQLYRQRKILFLP
nr:MAG TPA: hypothetical protein [Caudoviricetes sp.]